MNEDFDKLKEQKAAIIRRQNAPIRATVADLMAAYERIVRSNAGLSAHALERHKPWRCAEYVAAENALKALDVESDPPPGASKK